MAHDWGVFDLKDTGGVLREVHVAPCDSQGLVAGGHLLDDICLCEPAVEINKHGVRVVLHRGEQ